MSSERRQGWRGTSLASVTEEDQDEHDRNVVEHAGTKQMARETFIVSTNQKSVARVEGGHRGDDDGGKHMRRRVRLHGEEKQNGNNKKKGMSWRCASSP